MTAQIEGWTMSQYGSVAAKNTSKVYICPKGHKTYITGIDLPATILCASVDCLGEAKRK